MFQKESLLQVFELQILVWILTDPVIHESINVRLTGCYERVMATAVLFIGADSTGATGNFAPVLTQEPGQTLRFAPVPFMAVL